MTKKLFSRALAVLLILTLLAVPAQAAQSRSLKFSQDFTLSGNGAPDLVSVAMAQLGRTGASFQYSEEWCADFVSDCAKLAGQSSAIPAHNNVYGLAANILRAGGSVVTSNPQPGDICFIDWNGDGNWDHVEIVYMAVDSAVYTVGGNSGNQRSSLNTRYVTKHTPLLKQYVAQVLRPNYSSGEEETVQEAEPTPQTRALITAWEQEIPQQEEVRVNEFLIYTKK